VNSQQRDALIEAARGARRQAYARYSGFQVGAALRTTSGMVVCGANVENASYGLTLCAERVAVVRAVSEGERRFEALAIAAAGAIPPCGACLQVLVEFCDELPILLVEPDPGRPVTEVRLSQLLGNPFRPGHLRQR